MAKNLLSITVAGQLRWLEEAISTLRDPLDVLVIDDSTPGDEIRGFCEQKGLKFITKDKPIGLTDSWNTVYRYFKQNNYDNCILSNDDVRFPAGFSEGLFEGLKEFDLVAPLSNEPGIVWDSIHSPAHQEIRRYTDININERDIDRVQEIISKRYRKSPFRQSNFINGFCFAFSSSIGKFAFDKQFLFNPTHINTFNEYDLANRINREGGKVGICKRSYIFHWKAKTTEKLNKDWGRPGQDYREQLWRTEDDKRIETKDASLSQYVDRLKNHKHFSFVRYGDGEWKTLLEGSGNVACGLQVVNSQIQFDMIRSLTSHATEPEIIFGMQSLGARIYGHLIPDFLRDYELENIRWVDADVFHFASIDGLLYPLIEQLRKMKVVVIGPSLLRNLRDRVFHYAKFIEVKANNCYADQSAIKAKILRVHKELKENVVYSFCCGPLAETLILDLHSQMPKNFLIDFGSLWDVFCGVRSRKYTRSEKYTDDILKRNIGVKATLKIPGWLGRDEARILQKYVIEQQKESKSDLLEIGSWKGLSSVVITSLLSEDRRLWMIDHFRGSLEHQQGQRFYTPPKYTRRNKLWIYPELLENIVKCNVQNRIIILPLSSEKAAKVVDEKFSFIFIDGDHSYKGVSEDCNLWLPYLEENGVIIFHDYKHPPIHKFCNELKQNKNLSIALESRNMIVFRRH